MMMMEMLVMVVMIMLFDYDDEDGKGQCLIKSGSIYIRSQPHPKKKQLPKTLFWKDLAGCHIVGMQIVRSRKYEQQPQI